MVHWNELCSILATNSFQSYTLKALTCVEGIKKVDSFLMEAMNEDPPPLLKKGSTPEEAPGSSAMEVNTLILPPPVLVAPAPSRSEASRKVVQPIEPPPEVLSHKSSSHLSWGKHLVDPIVLGIDKVDILYNDVPKTMKKQKEIEEALRIEERIGELYKSQGGRSRGWTKALLESAIKPRCASGGDLYELKSSKSVFLWQMVGSDKPTSAVLDFLCVAKQIRIALWSEDAKTMLIFPAADYIGEEAKTDIPLYNISDTGLLLKSGLYTGAALVKFAQDEGWTLLAPHSVIHSLEKLTLAELASVGEKLGMGVVEGSKVERIAAIASFKLKSRLGSLNMAKDKS